MEKNQKPDEGVQDTGSLINAPASLPVTKPRKDPAQILTLAKKELDAVPEFARKIFYALPFKDNADDPKSKTTWVTGLSIKGAMVLSRLWGNCTNGGMYGLETPADIEVVGMFIDYEMNTITVRKKKVPKMRWSKKVKAMLKIQDFRLQTVLQSEVSKVTRNAILASLPVSIVEPFYQHALQIAARDGKKGKDVKPLAERISDMLRTFSSRYSVTEEQVLMFLGREEKGAITEEDIGKMIGVMNGIEDEEMDVEDLFPSIATVEDTQAKTRSAVDQVLQGSAPKPAAPAPVQDPKKDPDPAPAVKQSEVLFDGKGEMELPAQDPVVDPVQVLLTRINTMLMEIFPGFNTKPLALGDKKLLGQLLSRAFKVNESADLLERSAEELEKGIVQLGKDITYIKSQKAKS